MAQTTISVRMDENLKRDFDRVCDDLGMTMTTAITMLAKKMTREQRLPFEAAVDPFYSQSNLAHLHRAMKELDEGRGVRVTLEELEHMTLEEMKQMQVTTREQERATGE